MGAGLIGVVVEALLLGSMVSTPGLRAQSGARAGSQDDVQKLIAGLRGSSPDQRAASAASLGKMGARAAAAVPALIDMLADASTLFWDGMGPGGRPTGGHFSARESARSALLGIGEPALKPLIDALGRHPDARVREGAAEVLSGLNNTQAIEPLIRALGDATIVMDGVRRASVLRDEGPTRVCDVAAQELVSMGAAAVGDALWVHHASNATPAVRERVLAVLVQRKDARTLPIVTKNLASASRQTRITAVNQMARLAPPDIVSVLLPLLKDSDLRVRAVAVERLGAAAVAAVSGSPEENRVVTALEALQRDALREVDRRVKAYQDSQDVLRIVDRTREALAAIAEKRKHRP